MPARCQSDKKKPPTKATHTVTGYTHRFERLFFRCVCVRVCVRACVSVCVRVCVHGKGTLGSSAQVFAQHVCVCMCVCVRTMCVDGRTCVI